MILEGCDCTLYICLIRTRVLIETSPCFGLVEIGEHELLRICLVEIGQCCRFSSDVIFGQGNEVFTIFLI